MKDKRDETSKETQERGGNARKMKWNARRAREKKKSKRCRDVCVSFVHMSAP